jgi:hypothetical protein
MELAFLISTTRMNQGPIFPSNRQNMAIPVTMRPGPSEMLQRSLTHSALDCIATRDIMLGNELFLNYGEAWERA